MSDPLTDVRRLLIVAAILASSALAVFAYAPGLDGVFVFDSIERVIRNDALRIDAADYKQLLGAAYAGEAGYPQRGLAYVTLAVNYLLAGQQFDPFAFKLTNLIIHMVNGVLVMILAGQILSCWRQHDVRFDGGAAPRQLGVLAVVAMALWILHPVQLTSVLYVVQRMTSLSATWVLTGTILFMFSRAGFQQARPYAFGLMVTSVVVCTGVGFLFKQTALLLPAYVAVLEFFLFQRDSLSSRQKHTLLVFYAFILMLPVTAALVAVLADPELILGGYESRDFTLLQRLLTQARVVFFYLSLLVIPDVRRFGLYHDDIATSTGFFDPLTTAAALIGWVLIVIATVWGARRRAPWAFAVAWFLVGHTMESTLLPLEQVHEHRNYAPTVGVWITVAYYAGIGWRRSPRARPLVAAALCVWILSLALMAHMRAQSWRNPAVLMETLARNHPQSYRSVVGYAFNSVPASADLAIRFDAFQRGAALDVRAVAPLMEMAKLATAVGHFIGGADAGMDTAQASDDSLPIADMRLKLDARHNERLLGALDYAISERLANESVPPESVAALIALVDCALDGDSNCIALGGKARLWHEAALSNKRLPEDYQAVLELSLAKSYASSREFDVAVLHAQRAGRLAADNLSYRLQEAILYATLQRWDELGAVLEDIASRFPARAGSNATYRQLQELLRAR